MTATAALLSVMLAAPGALDAGVEAALRRLPPGGSLTVVVRLAGDADLRAAARAPGRTARLREVKRALLARAATAQRALRPALDAWRAARKVERHRPLWIVNGVSVTATPEVIRALAARADVVEVGLDEIDVVPLTAGPAEPSLQAVRAPDLWSLGLVGAGADVAILDSGVDVTHPDLAARWRGGAGAWFDPYGQHLTPYDPSGHGTWAAGVIVGGDAGGTSIGVAPGARFVAAKIFPDSGAASATAIHAAFEWVLDPDGDPGTDDAPRIVNGSWGFGSPGCNLEFQADVAALRAAGILPVFAAGNHGPGPSTSVSPANYPESLAVGAVDGSGSAYSLSSRGPSACGGGLFPTLAAPGVDVWTADLLSWYLPASGTSISAPHVSGVAALLAGAVPDASAAQLEAAMTSTARDVGAAGADDATGHGVVDALAAYQALLAAPAGLPVANDDAFTVPAGSAATFTAPGVLANDASPSGAPLAAALTQPTASGILALRADGGFDYTPAAGFSGVDLFRYRASDGARESGEATVTLAVPAPAPPLAAADAFTVREDGLLAAPAPGVLGNDVSPSRRSLSAALLAGPAAGTLTLRADGSFEYRPSANYAGLDAFSYRATDGAGWSAPAIVTLSVTAVNDPPAAADDAAATRAGVAVKIAVTANDSDVDGRVQAGTVALVTPPRYGTVAKAAGGVLAYTPGRWFRGSDAFTYRVKDDVGAWSNVATVRVQVR
jgi:subtilisin family serine protease